MYEFYGSFNPFLGACPFLGGCPLFGGSVMRGSTVSRSPATLDISRRELLTCLPPVDISA